MTENGGLMNERPPWSRPEDDDEAEEEEQHQPAGTEGVRIIGPEEAAEAVERGNVAPRRAEGAPRYGDRPPAPPGDARPSLRFPLRAGDQAGDLTRPRVSGRGTSPLPPWTEPPTGEVPRLGPEPEDADDQDLDAWASFTESAPRWRDQPGDWDELDFDESSMLHDEETRVGALDTSDRPPPDDFFALETHDEPLKAASPPPPVAG
ncbi:MAG: hypothetical protein ACRDZ9_02300, partial [Acidimicrobiales bacterium]